MDVVRDFNQAYTGEQLDRIAFPMGGIGAGMVCLEGGGSLSHLSLRHHPEVFNEPLCFAALCVKGERENLARVLEGPVPRRKPLFPWGEAIVVGSGSGAPARSYGLPRFEEARFEARFPFARVSLHHAAIPLEVALTGWSPFIPGNADDSSLPVAALEYRFVNSSESPVDAVFSFHSTNFMHQMGAPGRSVLETPGGFVLWQPGSKDAPEQEGAFGAVLDAPDTRVNCHWFRGGWFDPLTMTWKTVREGAMPEAGAVSEGAPSAGGSLYLPFSLEPAQERILRLLLAWYVPHSDLRTDSSRSIPAGEVGAEAGTQRFYRPWYAGRFESIGEVNRYWAENYRRLRDETEAFSDCFYDTTLPPEVVEAVSANLSILKSPTVLRQMDGRLWAWEGCGDRAGCCPGSCTHVWNYAQALPHLFPQLERSLRLTEFDQSQDEEGHQCFRASLPIRPSGHDFHAAADGQLGGVMKVYREWRISGDRGWLQDIWPRVKRSLAFAIESWDPDRRGVVLEPHHNTYDIEFWGADSMCTSIYLGALRAAAAMADALGDDADDYLRLYEKGRKHLESELWNGEYFHQAIQWQGLRAASPLDPGSRSLDHDPGYSPEAIELLEQEGPKYQYGSGCLSDGVLGAWLARVCGIGEILDPEKVRSHLLAVHRYNLVKDLSDHGNPQRSGYAFGNEGGLLLCSWPRGGEPSLPFVYSNEVWTGIEYQVASHLIMEGRLDEGLEIVRSCRRRYDGRTRNPFNEIECGHWYARAMSSYSLLQALCGARYDAVEKKLRLRPAVEGDFRAFLATATGFGSVGVRSGVPFLEVRHGAIEASAIDYQSPEAARRADP
jgi:uncharacterized protein (DUF608 family)